MPRFYFGLDGTCQVVDGYGVQIQTPLEAFRAAQRLAHEISTIRPELRGNTCVALTEADRPHDVYLISIV